MAQHRHRRSARSLVVLTLILGGFAACTQSPPATASGEGGWLAGTADQKFDTVAKHLRGFDMAMVETVPEARVISCRPAAQPLCGSMISKFQRCAPMAPTGRPV